MIKKRGYDKEGMREVIEKEPKEEKQRWKKVLGITFLAIVITLVVAYASGVHYFKDKFFSGTTINSINASYATVEEVENIVADQVAKYRLQVKGRGGYEENILPADIGYVYTRKGEVERFKKEQNPFKWPLMFIKDFAYEFESTAVYDMAKLRSAIDRLKCLDKSMEEAPKDAELVFNGTTYELHKEQQGKKVIKEKLAAAVKKAVETGKNTVDLEKEDCYEKPKITSENPTLQKKFERLYHYTKTRVEYSFGDETEVLDGSIINNWLSVDEDGTVNLHTDGIAEYVYSLAQKYDTYNKTRNFETHDGSYVQVNGGSFGWMIDQNAENEQLTQIIRDGRQVKREPVYAQTAGTRRNCDLGDTYVEVDLSRQHLWMYRDGVTILETDFVSGDTSKGHTTPGGTFALYWKKSPSVLKSDKPGDSYETPVSYWMPFNGGIGFHDASWRGSFGGSVYTYNGSHGCVNMPTWAAGEMYNNIYAGYPIICYYR